MFSIKAEYEHQMTHYLELGSDPTFKAHTWERVQELDMEPAFAGFKADFLQRMKEKNAQSCEN